MTTIANTPPWRRAEIEAYWAKVRAEAARGETV